MIRKILFIIVFLLLLSIDYAFAAFSIDDEKKVGKEFYEKLENSGSLYHDVRVSTYLTQVGNRIAANIHPQLFGFRFSVIKSSAINAFATPGGYVYVNMGLISLVENESELASVIAHEIAHVTARHVADIIEKSQKINIATLAAVLAGAFLGGGSDLTAAVTGFSIATATSLNLKYSRENEEEADRLGMSYLIQAGYDGQSMPDFLKIMRQYEYYSSNIPSYFLTHPGTDERIRYLDALLQTRYFKDGSKSIVGQMKRIQTLIMLEQRNPDSNLKFFQAAVEKNPSDTDSLYGLAVTQDKLGMTAQSIETFQKVLAMVPKDRDILRDLGVAYFKAGRPIDAVSFLSKAVESDVDNVTALYYLGKAYEGMSNYASASEIYKQLTKKDTADVEVFYSLASVYGKTNNLGESHYYFGLYFRRKNKPGSSLFHFKEALKYFASDSARAKEIESFLKPTKAPDIERKQNSKRPRKN